MAGIQPFPNTMLVLLFCLHTLIGYCQTKPYLVAGSNNTVLSAGENLTLACNFANIVEYNVLWKINDTTYIGRCRTNSNCEKFTRFKTDLRYNLVQKERQVFELMITYIEISDSGRYECIVETSPYPKVHEIQVSVFPLPTVEITGVTTESPISLQRTTQNGQRNQHTPFTIRKTTQSTPGTTKLTQGR